MNPEKVICPKCGAEMTEAYGLLQEAYICLNCGDCTRNLRLERLETALNELAAELTRPLLPLVKWLAKFLDKHLKHLGM